MEAALVQRIQRRLRLWHYWLNKNSSMKGNGYPSHEPPPMENPRCPHLCCSGDSRRVVCIFLWAPRRHRLLGLRGRQLRHQRFGIPVHAGRLHEHPRRLRFRGVGHGIDRPCTIYWGDFLGISLRRAGCDCRRLHVRDFRRLRNDCLAHSFHRCRSVLSGLDPHVHQQPPSRAQGSREGCGLEQLGARFSTFPSFSPFLPRGA